MGSRKKTRGQAHPRAAKPPEAPVADGAATWRRKLEQATRKKDTERWVLKLYVTGATPASQRAIARIHTICEEHLLDRYRLEVIDVYQLPALARDEQIIATPTLIRVLPVPLRRVIGDLTKVENVIFGLDMRPAR